MSMRKHISLMLIVQSACVPMAIPYATNIEAIRQAMHQYSTDNDTNTEASETTFIALLKKEFNELVESLQSINAVAAQQLQVINTYIQQLKAPVEIYDMYLIAGQCAQSDLNFGDLPAEEQEKLRTLLLSMNTFFMKALGLEDEEVQHLLAATTKLESDFKLFAELDTMHTTYANELERLLQQPISPSTVSDMSSFDAAELFKKFAAEDEKIDDEMDNETKNAMLKAFLASGGIAGAFLVRNIFTYMKAHPKAKVIDPATIWAGLKSISQPLKIVGGIIIGAAILYKISKWIHQECKEKRKKLKKTYKDHLDDHEKKIKKEMSDFKEKVNADFKKRESDARLLQEKLQKQADDANKLYMENIALSGTALRDAKKMVEDLRKDTVGDIDSFKRQITALLDGNKENIRDVCVVLEKLQLLLATVSLNEKTKQEVEILQKEIKKKVVRIQDNLLESPEAPKKKSGLRSIFRRKSSSSKVTPGGAGSGSDGEALSGNSAREDSGIEPDFEA